MHPFEVDLVSIAWLIALVVIKSINPFPFVRVVEVMELYFASGSSYPFLDLISALHLVVVVVSNQNLSLAFIITSMDSYSTY